MELNILIIVIQGFPSFIGVFRKNGDPSVNSIRTFVEGGIL